MEKVGLHKLNKKTNNIIYIIAMILIVGSILNWFRFDSYAVQHDVWYMDMDTHENFIDGGHMDYIYEIAHNHRLPQTNEMQFYHPPLHHFISAVFLNIIENFTTDIELQCLLLQVVPLIEYILLMVVICKLLKTLHITGKYKVLIFALLLLHPSHFMLSRSLNNDMLVMLLIYTSIWRAIKWYQRPTVKNIAITGAFAGLAVMTKVSGGLVAIPILYLLIKRVMIDYKSSDDKNRIIKKYIGQTLLLGMIALPLGLWYPIRNYIKFNQGILYILDPRDVFLMENVGNKNLWERFGFDFTTNAIYFSGTTSYNIPLAIIQTSVIGELGQVRYALLVSGVLIMNMVAIVFSIYCFIKTMFVGKIMKRHSTMKKAMALFLIISLVSYIMMNVKLPFPSTMHFRYIVPAVFVALLSVKYYLEDIRHKNTQKEKVLFYIILFFTIYLYIFAYASQ